MTTLPTRPEPSPADLKVLECLAEGMTRGAIARYLDKSANQIKRQTKAIYDALGAANAAQAVGISYEAGWLPRSIPTPSGKDTPR